jgi:hypothetical protein
MIGYPCNLFTWPLVLLLGVVDAWLIVALLHLAARRIAKDRWSFQVSLVHPLVEAPVELSRRRLSRWCGGAVQPWAPWLAVFATAIGVRQVLAALIIRWT